MPNNYRHATQDDCETDIRALERLVSEPRQFYNLIRIMSLNFDVNGNPLIEE